MIYKIDKKIERVYIKIWIIDNYDKVISIGLIIFSEVIRLMTNFFIQFEKFQFGIPSLVPQIRLPVQKYYSHGPKTVIKLSPRSHNKLSS